MLLVVLEYVNQPGCNSVAHAAVMNELHQHNIMSSKVQYDIM
jgi:hypothetical protein